MLMQSLMALSDAELFSELKRLVAAERESTVDVLLHLAEVDRRRAVEETATPSLFVYCVRELGYSEGAAYRRLHAARCAKDFPRIYVLLKRGRISLTTVSLLAPHLCQENYRTLLRLSCGMTRYEVERLVATLDPRQEKKEMIRPLGTPPASPAPDPVSSTLPIFGAPPPAPTASKSEGDGSMPPVRPSDASPSPRRRVEFRFSADEEFLSKFRRAREVLWHKHPRGLLEEILGEALEALLERRDPERRLARNAKRRETNGAARQESYLP